MFGNLDNEVIFKKTFTNKIVFKAFVRDILGIEIEVDKIETIADLTGLTVVQIEELRKEKD